MLDIMKRAFGGGQALKLSRRDTLVLPVAGAATAAAATLAPFRVATGAGHAESTYLPPADGRVPVRGSVDHAVADGNRGRLRISVSPLAADGRHPGAHVRHLERQEARRRSPAPRRVLRPHQARQSRTPDRRPHPVQLLTPRERKRPVFMEGGSPRGQCTPSCQEEITETERLPGYAIHDPDPVHEVAVANTLPESLQMTYCVRCK